jgi:hypothetical protein
MATTALEKTPAELEAERIQRERQEYLDGEIGKMPKVYNQDTIDKYGKKPKVTPATNQKVLTGPKHKYDTFAQRLKATIKAKRIVMNPHEVEYELNKDKK